MHPFDGPIAKYYRANELFRSLKEQHDSFVDQQRYRVRIAERNPKTGRTALRVVFIKDEPIPSEWPLLIGEIAHNLRSALDHLACQLALKNSPENPAVFEETSFPIFLHGPKSGAASRFKWTRNKPSIKHISSSHIAQYKNLQPYLRKNGGRLSPLWLLHDLNNADKHRTIQVQTKMAGGMSLIITGPMGDFDISDPRGIYRRIPLRDGAKVGDAVTVGSPEGVQIKFDLDAEVIFWDGCAAVKGLPVISTLQQMVDKTSDIIMEFITDFPPRLH